MASTRISRPGARADRRDIDLDRRADGPESH
jgi:hypothetical protein